MFGGAGGNRTPVRFGFIVRDTTIPELVVFGTHTAGSVESEDITAGSFSSVSSLSYSQRSFPAVHHYFCCQAVVVRPRESLLVPMTLYRLNQAARATRELPCLVCPVLESEQLRSHDPTKQPPRRNRSAPCQIAIRKAPCEAHQIITIAGNCDTIAKEDNLE